MVAVDGIMLFTNQHVSADIDGHMNFQKRTGLKAESRWSTDIVEKHADALGVATIFDRETGQLSSSEIQYHHIEASILIRHWNEYLARPSSTWAEIMDIGNDISLNHLS